MSRFSKGVLKSILTDRAQEDFTWEAGDWCAEKYGITRKEQDDVAIESYVLAREAIGRGVFSEQIVPVDGRGTDEWPFLGGTSEKIRNAEPIPGCSTVTKLNASKVSDGAAGVVVVSRQVCEEFSLKPLAVILGHANYTMGKVGKEFTIAPPHAIESALSVAGLRLEQIDLFEINDAFASVRINTCRALGIPNGKVNVVGSAIAMGHPLGASGAILLVKAAHLLKLLNKEYAVVVLCYAMGGAIAMAIRNPNVRRNYKHTYLCV